MSLEDVEARLDGDQSNVVTEAPLSPLRVARNAKFAITAKELREVCTKNPDNEKSIILAKATRGISDGTVLVVDRVDVMAAIEDRGVEIKQRQELDGDRDTDERITVTTKVLCDKPKEPRGKRRPTEQRVAGGITRNEGEAIRPGTEFAPPVQARRQQTVNTNTTTTSPNPN